MTKTNNNIEECLKKLEDLQIYDKMTYRYIRRRDIDMKGLTLEMEIEMAEQDVVVSMARLEYLKDLQRKQQEENHHD